MFFERICKEIFRNRGINGLRLHKTYIRSDLILEQYFDYVNPD